MHSILTRSTLAACCLLCCQTASAGLILSVEYGQQFGELTFDAATLNTVLAAGNTHTSTGNLENTALVNSADSLWVGLGNAGQPLTATELANLQGFINSGRRVVIHGEHGGWATWNSSVLGALGGVAQNNSNNQETARAVVGNSGGLTDGVSEITLNHWSDVASGNRTDLVENGAVSVWGPDANVLLFLDGNWLLGTPGVLNRNSGFTSNVGTWLSQSQAVPEPTSFAMLGLVGCGLSFRRRRRKAA